MGYGIKTIGRAYDRTGLSFFEALAFAARECDRDAAAAVGVYHVETDRLILSMSTRSDGECVVCDRDGVRIVDLRGYGEV